MFFPHICVVLRALTNVSTLALGNRNQTFAIIKLVCSMFECRMQTLLIAVKKLRPITYKFSQDRMWRKTRSPTDDYDIWGYRCYGVDPNRNWDHYWNSK